MNLNDLPSQLSSAQRMELQTSIENAIQRLGPDFDIAVELVDAIHKALHRRYRSEQLWDVDHYCDYFVRALERGNYLDADGEIDEMAVYKASLDDDPEIESGDFGVDCPRVEE